MHAPTHQLLLQCILETNSFQEMAFERSVATEKSPFVKLRAIAFKVNFYPLIDFVHLYIIKFFIPLSSFSLFSCHRLPEFLCKSLWFLYHAF